MLSSSAPGSADERPLCSRGIVAMRAFQRGLATAGEGFLVRQARRRALLNQQKLPPITGEVQGLWRQMLLRDDMKEVRASVTEGLLKTLRAASAAEGGGASGGGSKAVSAEEFATAVPQAVPRALRLVWKREQRFLALRRRAHALPERLAQLQRESPELAKTLASFVARPDTVTASLNPLFGEATLRATVPPSRRPLPRDASTSYKQQLYRTAMDNLRLLLAPNKPPVA